MSRTNDRPSEHRIDRREFFGIGIRSAATLAALPAAAAVLTACGGGDESPAPAPPAAKPEPAPAPKQAEAPKPAPTAPKPAPAAPAEPAGDGALVTDIAAMAPVVASLQYVNQSAKPDQNCGNCQFYTAGGDGRGKCQLFAQGLVAEAGWCASWAARIS